MADYDNTNTFTLFKNDKGDNQKRPDYTGTINIVGAEFQLSAWIREGKKGKFMSGTVQPKRDARQPAGNEAKPNVHAKAGFDDFEDDIPF
jgi:hypothetical protein